MQYGAYAKPTSLGTQPAASVEPQAGTPAADIGWREFFRDPRLQRLIELSLANNRDLRVAVQRVEEARAQYGVQRGAQWPSIGAGIQGQRQHLPANMRAPGAGSISSSYQAGIGLTTFEIDLFGRLRSLSEAAYQQYLSTEQAQKSVHITLVGSVAQAYFNLRAAEVQMDLTQRTLASRQESYNLVKRRFDGGVSSELDLNQAKTLLDSASSSLAELARARASRQRAGGAGRALARGPARAGRVRPRATAGHGAGGLPSDLLERRPDIVAAEHQLKSANANIGAARAAFFPTISLTGLLGPPAPRCPIFSRAGRGTGARRRSPRRCSPAAVSAKG